MRLAQVFTLELEAAFSVASGARQALPLPRRREASQRFHNHGSSSCPFGGTYPAREHGFIA
jgi:hypothetical protein